MATLHRHFKVLLMAGLISSGLLTGCESNFDHFERYYKPAEIPKSIAAATAPRGTTRLKLVYSSDPDKDGTLLRQAGYVLIGTTSFTGAPDLSYADRAVVAQGQKVGAAVVLMKARSSSTVTSCCAPDESLEVSSEGGATYFASYWARYKAEESPQTQ